MAIDSTKVKERNFKFKLANDFIEYLLKLPEEDLRQRTPDFITTLKNHLGMTLNYSDIISSGVRKLLSSVTTRTLVSYLNCL